MTEAVQIELVRQIVPALTAIGTLVVWWSVRKIKQQTNGHLSELREKVKRAENLMPGVGEIPPGSEVTATLTVNDPSTTDPPIVIEKKTKRSE